MFWIQLLSFSPLFLYVFELAKRSGHRVQPKHVGMVRDMLVFLALCIFPIASFWLANYSTDVSFYTALLMMSILVLFSFRLFKPTWAKVLPYFQYDANLNPLSLGIIAVAALGMFVFSSVLSSAIHVQSILSVPTQKLALSSGQVSLPPFWSDTLYQITLVASAEEASKLVVIIAVFLTFRRVIGNFPAATVAVVSAVGGWALLHTYQNPNYQGSTMWVMVSGAFIDGLMLIAVLYLTKSWLATVLTHFTYNFSGLCQTYGVFSAAAGMVFLPFIVALTPCLVLTLILGRHSFLGRG